MDARTPCRDLIGSMAAGVICSRSDLVANLVD